MILLKVGRFNPAHPDACNIKLNSPNVSSIHAEILVDDDDKVYIEDKGSTNGTWIGNERLQPGKEYPVHRGDRVRLADVDLNWAQVPHAPTYPNTKQIISIGSNYRNNIVVDDPFVSRFHAILRIDNKNKAYLRDLGSRNGTIVNGMRIQPNKDVLLKKGDSVVLGNKDISAQIHMNMPRKSKAGLIIGIIAAAAVILAGVVFAAFHFFHRYEPFPPEQARTAVVYVTASYRLYAVLDDQPIEPAIWGAVMGELYEGVEVKAGEIPYEEQSYCATAFFVDREGRMVTNRHVAMPWDMRYQDPNKAQELASAVDQFVEGQLPAEVESYEHIALINEAIGSDPRFALWRMVYAQAVKAYNEGREKDPLSYINSLIRQLHKSHVSSTGRLNEISVGYAGRNYTHMNEYDRCVPTTVSDNPDIDVAILQLNTKKTPDDIVRVFDVKDFYTGEVIPLKDNLVWIGYPRGNTWNLDAKTHALEPQIRDVKVAKQPSKYDFEIQGEVLGGASGSPLYDPETGRLFGVVYAHWADGATYGLACQAKYILELYNKDKGILNTPAAE